MIWYILASTILLYYFELIGRCVLYKLNISNFKLSFGIGIITFLACAYITTSLITALNCSFYLILFIYIVLFLVSLFMIIKNRKNISFFIDLKKVILLVIFETIMLFFAYNTTLGNLNGFDTTHYLNLVTTNIKSNSMNTGYFRNAIQQNRISIMYTFQSYYYIASVISYIITSIVDIFHKTYYQTVFIWVFQMLFNAFFFSLITNSVDVMRLKRKNVFTIIILLFFLLVYGRLYYYNVYGFYGNTYRIITVGYSTLILYILSKSNRDNNLLLLLMCSLLASASVSSSGLFIDIFILFGAYFILCNKYEDILKYYSFAILFIMPNLLSVALRLNITISIIISVIVSVILFIFGNNINRILSKKKILLMIFVLSFTFMFVSSFLITKNIFDFSSFLNNHSERGDMTLNYFNLKSLGYLIYLKVFILLLLFSTLFSIKRESFLIFIYVLLICIFNPFCTPILEEVLFVHYRAFNIIINPFTIIIFIDFIISYFNEKAIIIYLLYILIILVTIQNNPFKPLYYMNSYKPNYSTKGIDFENYNAEFKIPKDEKDCTDAIFDNILYNNVINPYIISPSLLTQSFIPNGRYLYTRNEYYGCPYKTEAEKQLYAIFYPERYLGDHLEGVTPNYNKIYEYIKEAKIDYLIVDKTKEYYDENNNTFSYLYYRVLDSFYPMLETDRYIVFYCSEQ